MPATLDAVSHDAMILPPDDRLTLAYRLLESVEPESRPEVDAAWDREIQRRIKGFRAGEIATVPAAKVFAEMREIAPD